MAGIDVDELHHKEFIERTTPYEKRFIQAVLNQDQQLKQDIIDQLPEFEKALRRGTSVTKGVENLLNVDAAKELFVGVTIPVLQELIQSEGQAQMDRLDTTDPFDPLNDYIQDRVRQSLDMTAASYTDTTLKLLNNSLGEGIANGESMAKLTARVSDVFDLGSDYRAAQVARTTVFSAANAAARDAYRQSGVVTEVKWHTAEDEVVCEFCGPMNGKVIGIEETFFADGEKVQGADGGVLNIAFGDIIDPPMHPNCRCFTNAVISNKSKEESTVVITVEDLLSSIADNEVQD